MGIFCTHPSSHLPGVSLTSFDSSLSKFLNSTRANGIGHTLKIGADMGRPTFRDLAKFPFSVNQDQLYGDCIQSHLWFQPWTCWLLLGAGGSKVSLQGGLRRSKSFSHSKNQVIVPLRAIRPNNQSINQPANFYSANIPSVAKSSVARH